MKNSIMAASLCLLLGGVLNATPMPENAPLTNTDEFNELDRALDWLQEQASKRKATREQYEHTASLIIARARVFYTKDSEFLVFQSQIVQSLNRALDVLAEKARNREATRKDYERVADMLISRARMVVSGTPGE